MYGKSLPYKHAKHKLILHVCTVTFIIKKGLLAQRIIVGKNYTMIPTLKTFYCPTLFEKCINFFIILMSLSPRSPKPSLRRNVANIVSPEPTIIIPSIELLKNSRKLVLNEVPYLSKRMSYENIMHNRFTIDSKPQIENY
jgi:hypothetical protein